MSSGQTIIQVFLDDTAEIEAGIVENAILEVFLAKDTELEALFN